MQGKQLGENQKNSCDLEKNDHNRKKNKVPTNVGFLIYKAPIENERKIIVLIRVGKKQSRKFQNRNIRVKKYRKMLGFEPVPRASDPCCPTHCAVGTLGISVKCL